MNCKRMAAGADRMCMPEVPESMFIDAVKQVPGTQCHLPGWHLRHLELSNHVLQRACLIAGISPFLYQANVWVGRRQA